MATVWIFGRVNDEPKEGEPEFSRNWELMGVFTTEEKTVEATTQHNDLIWPLELDERLPDETIEPPGAYFPRHPADPKIQCSGCRNTRIITSQGKHFYTCDCVDGSMTFAEWKSYMNRHNWHKK